MRRGRFSLVVWPAVLCGLVLPLFAGHIRAGENSSAWVVEWDAAAGMREVASVGARLSSLQIFSANFRADDSLRYGEAAQQVAASAHASPAADRVFVSVVNDVVNENGTNILKDPELVSRLMATELSRSNHADELVALAVAGNFAGVEMDYEQVKNKDWWGYLDFCAALAQRLGALDKRLRVVIEPRRQFLNQPLPAGPEYSLMAYNLHGGHSAPGPKATPAFIQRLASYCRAGKNTPFPRLALATGGFVWHGAGAATGVTEATARSLAEEAGVEPRRDLYSQYLVFQFSSERYPDAEVWFADSQTLAHLRQAADEAGFTAIDIWRLGGNSNASLDVLSQ